MRPQVAEFVRTRLARLLVLSRPADTPTVPTIGTHDGSFHCDEVLACGLLLCTPMYRSSPILRTRNEAWLAQCSVVVDVGAVYDPEALRFDHHQPSFTTTFEGARIRRGTRLSSAGLVYMHFGRQLLKEYLEGIQLTLGEDGLDLLFDRLYTEFIEHIDGIDNGVEAFGIDPPNTEAATVRRNYAVTSTLSQRIGRLYPRWNDAPNPNAETDTFVSAMHLALGEFLDVADYYARAWLPARHLVAEALSVAMTHHPSGSIIVFDKGGLPWKDHLFDAEDDAGCVGRTIYALFQDTKGGWRVQAVPKDKHSFQSRRPLPWKGLRDGELSAAAGVEGCVFVHVSGFIGGALTREGAMAMAVKALAA